MILPCEICVRKLVPAIKRELVLELYKKHSIPKAEIARRLSITRGSVTQYLTRSRAKKSYKIRKLKKSSKLITKLANDVAKKKITEDKLIQRFCAICKLNQKLITLKCLNL